MGNNKKFWNWARDADTNERVLYFDGEISDETWWGDEVTPGLFRRNRQIKRPVTKSGKESYNVTKMS